MSATIASPAITQMVASVEAVSGLSRSRWRDERTLARILEAFGPKTLGVIELENVSAINRVVSRSLTSCLRNLYQETFETS